MHKAWNSNSMRWKKSASIGLKSGWKWGPETLLFSCTNNTGTTRTCGGRICYSIAMNYFQWLRDSVTNSTHQKELESDSEWAWNELWIKSVEAVVLNWLREPLTLALSRWCQYWADNVSRDSVRPGSEQRLRIGSVSAWSMAGVARILLVSRWRQQLSWLWWVGSGCKWVGSTMGSDPSQI